MRSVPKFVLQLFGYLGIGLIISLLETFYLTWQTTNFQKLTRKVLDIILSYPVLVAGGSPAIPSPGGSGRKVTRLNVARETKPSALVALVGFGSTG